MKVAQNAHVVLSLGSQNVTTPSLVGESLRVARIQLLQQGLQLGEVTTYSAPTAMSDTILQQSPLPGARAASPRVDLLVAQGASPASYIMPWVVGMPLPDADRLLTSSGFKLSKTTFIPSPQWPKGVITEQMPEPGVKITNDTPIEMVVAE
jgi:beta-lactam-binding protein with PASTA domain